MKCNVTEDFLVKFGHSFQYLESVSLDSIALQDSALHNIRPVGLDQDKVLEYSIAMSDGASFPAIVVYPQSSGKLGILTGFHRAEAAKLAGLKTLDAYKLALDEKKDSRTVEMLQRVLNTLNGVPPSQAERFLHATRMVSLGYSVADAARMFHLRASSLANRISVQHAEQRVSALGLKINTSALPDTALLEVNRIKNPQVFQSALELLQAARLTADQARDLSREVRDQTTDAGALAVIDTWKKRLATVIAETGGGKFASPTSPARRTLTYLDRLNRFARVEVFHNLNLIERREAIRRVRTAIAQLQKLLKQLERAEPKTKGRVA